MISWAYQVLQSLATLQFTLNGQKSLQYQPEEQGLFTDEDRKALRSQALWFLELSVGGA